MEDPIVFVAAKRTPFGKFGGSFLNLSATDLGVKATQACFETSPVTPNDIDQVIFGNVIQSSPDAAYLARHIALKSEIPLKVPALTINRLCGSGFEAIAQGARLIQLGEAKTVLAGGSENMSQAPYVLRNARFGYRMNNSQLEDALTSGLYDSYAELQMAQTAENLAVEYDISKDQCDEFAALSQNRAENATQKGIFDDEVYPVVLKDRKGEITIKTDEHIRSGTTKESLSKLKAVFKEGGVVTAGNASGICDGAAAVVLTKLSLAKANHWPVLGQYLGSHVVGCDPRKMGIGPVGATHGVLKKTGLSLQEMKLVEVNEAFAAQYLSVEKALELDRSITNVNGGAIAIGHPLATSGTRLTLHLLSALSKKGGGYGLATACIGGGQGIAVVVKV